MRDFLKVCLIMIVLPSLVFASEEEATLKDVLDADLRSEEVLEQLSDKDKRVLPGQTPLSTVVAIRASAAEGDWVAAGQWLDMRYLPDDMAQAEAAELMRQLAIIWGQQRIVDLSILSHEPEGHLDDGLVSYRDLVGELSASNSQVPVYLQRIPDGNGNRVWKISNATVKEIPALWDEFGYHPAVEKMGQYLPDFNWLGMRNWQLVSLLLVVIFAWITAWVLRSLALALLQRWPKQEATFHRFFSVPLRWYVFFKLLQLGSGELGLSIKARVFVNPDILGYLATTFLVLGVIEFAAAVFVSRANDKRYWSGIIRPLSTIAKIISVLVIALFWLAEEGYSISTILTGLGIGSLAIALAAQKTLENVFGAITLYIAQPVKPGDFCRFGNIAGVVEEIGLRATRIRQLDRTIVYVPNAVLASSSLENLSLADWRRFNKQLFIKLDTSADQIRLLLTRLRELVYSHPRLVTEGARVRFEEIARDAHVIAISCYVDTGSWPEFLAVAEDLNLRTIDLLEELNIVLAVPEQRLTLERAVPSANVRQQASDEVVRLEGNNELPFPDFSSDDKAAMHGSIPYPVRGRQTTEGDGSS